MVLLANDTTSNLFLYPFPPSPSDFFLFLLWFCSITLVLHGGGGCPWSPLSFGLHPAALIPATPTKLSLHVLCWDGVPLYRNHARHSKTSVPGSRVPTGNAPN